MPEEVLISICAPLVAPCCASYIEVFTRTSVMVSGAGEGIDSPMARYIAALLCTGTELRALVLPMPVLFTTRAEATWLVLLPLNRLLASTPFSK